MGSNLSTEQLPSDSEDPILLLLSRHFELSKRELQEQARRYILKEIAAPDLDIRPDLSRLPPDLANTINRVSETSTLEELDSWAETMEPRLPYPFSITLLQKEFGIDEQGKFSNDLTLYLFRHLSAKAGIKSDISKDQEVNALEEFMIETLSSTESQDAPKTTAIVLLNDELIGIEKVDDRWQLVASQKLSGWTPYGSGTKFELPGENDKEQLAAIASTLKTEFNLDDHAIDHLQISTHQSSPSTLSLYASSLKNELATKAAQTQEGVIEND